MTKFEIIKDTLDYIHKNGIAKNTSGECVYRNADNIGCAVGSKLDYRKFKGETLRRYNEGCCAVKLDREVEGGLEYLLKRRYQGHDLCFWVDMQEMHDDERHFYVDHNGNTCITRMGMHYIIDLFQEYGIPVADSLKKLGLEAYED